MGYGNLTIFKMAAVCHVGFWKLAVFIMRPLSAWRSASAYKISPKSDNRSMNYDQKANFKMAVAAILNLKKNSFFGHVTVTGFNIWCSVPIFIKIWQFFTEIWRFNDFQNGGRPPSWILHICIFCPVAFVSMPFCFLVQMSLKLDNRLMSNGQISDFQDGSRCHLNFKNCNFWSRDCNRVQYLMQCTKFHQNRTIFHWDMAFNDFQNGGGPPCWILKICSFCHVTLVDLPFCFLIRNFAEIRQSVDELWPKNANFKMAAAAVLSFKNSTFWSSDCNRVQYLMLCTTFHQNRTMFNWDMAI